MTRDRARKQAIRARMTASNEPYSVAARRLASQPDLIEPDPVEPEPVEPDAAVVLACVQRTLAAPSARLRWRLDLALPGTTAADRRQARGLRGLARRGLGTLFNLAMHPSLQGFVEPAAQRYQAANRGRALLFADGRLYRGMPGRALPTVAPERPDDDGDVYRNLLWGLWAVAGTVTATSTGAEAVRDVPCRRYVVQADLDQAGDAVRPVGDWPVQFVTPPPSPRLPELTVWVDDRYVRQVRFAYQASHDIVPELSGYGALTHLELWDFGVSTAQLDWSRLPDFPRSG